MPDREFSSYNEWPDALLLVDRAGSIAFANDRAEQLFGYEAGELLGQSMKSLVPEQLRDRPSARRGEYFRHPGVLGMGSGQPIRGLRNDGREISLEVFLAPANDAPYAVATIRDITERVLAQQKSEKALVEAKEHSDRNQAILSAVFSNIALLDAQGNIIAVNERWTDFGRENGTPSQPKVGVHANYLDICRGAADDVPDAQRALSGILSVLNGTRRVFTMTYGCHSRSEERWFVMTVTPVRTGDGGAVVAHTNITERIIALRELESTLKEVGQLKDQLQSEQRYLREEIKSDHNFDDIIGKSEAIHEALDAVEHVARTDATVLLLGETGTGKELFARAIHANSSRSDRALIKVDCATLPEGLVESELFGHLKGAFTGADRSRAGRFELAHRGTIFLDEIGELSPNLQAKLLRVLQEGEIQRLGSEKVQNVDVRVIAASNRNLRQEVEEGRFRADLFYRLNVFPIEIPPLRHRAGDVSLLAAFFVSKCASRFGRKIKTVPLAAQKMLAAYDWPGNVRELQHVIERSVILSKGTALEVVGIPQKAPIRSQKETTSLKQDLKDIERQSILETLEECHWKIKGEGNAASELGLKPSTLRSRMKTLGISRPSPVNQHQEGTT